MCVCESVFVLVHMCVCASSPSSTRYPPRGRESIRGLKVATREQEAASVPAWIYNPRRKILAAISRARRGGCFKDPKPWGSAPEFPIYNGASLGGFDRRIRRVQTSASDTLRGKDGVQAGALRCGVLASSFLLLGMNTPEQACISTEVLVRSLLAIIHHK